MRTDCCSVLNIETYLPTIHNNIIVSVSIIAIRHYYTTNIENAKNDAAVAIMSSIILLYYYHYNNSV